MANNFKSYSQAVTDGDVFVWSDGGDKIAKKERFDNNTKFVVDNQSELWNKVNDAMIANAGTQSGLNSSVEQQIEDLEKIIALAPANLDSLKEIADAINNDENFATTITNALNDRFTKSEINSLLNDFLKQDGSAPVTGSLIPDVADTYTLGSVEKPFKDLFVGNHSLYVGGSQVVSNDSGTITISADMDQNVQLKTEGGGDIEFYPNGTGVIQLKGSVQIPSSKFLLTSDNLPLQIGNSLTVSGDIDASDVVAIKLNGTDINSFLQDIANLKSLIGSDNADLDNLQEIVDFIEQNRETLNALAISNIAGLQTALDGKVEKVAGKGLSTEDFTTGEQTKLAGVEASANNYIKPSAEPIAYITGLQDGLNGKVDKVSGKGLSEHDFSAALLTKLNGIETSATKDQTKADIDALNIDAGTVNGKTVLTSVPANASFSDTLTKLEINGNSLDYTDENGTVTSHDLSLYLDDTNAARINSGTLNSSTGVVTFTRDDSTTFTVNMSALLDQNASEILTKVKSVDGAGSGLDADTVDGLHASSFARVFNQTTAPTSFKVGDIWFDSTDEILSMGTSVNGSIEWLQI